MENQDNETGRIILTSAKNRKKQRPPVPYPGPDPDGHTQDWYPPKKRTNRQTLVGVWVLTVLLLLGLCGVLLWHSGLLSSLPAVSPTVKFTLTDSSSQKLPAVAGDVAQVELLSPGAVAVLRTDGTVDVGGNEALAAQTASWSNVVRLVSYYNYLGAIRADGTAVCSFCDLSGWTDIEKLYIDVDCAAGIRSDGTLVTAGTWRSERDPSGWSNMKELYIGEETTIGLRRDRTVRISNPQRGTCDAIRDAQELYWESGIDNFCARLSDGRFVHANGEEMTGLRGAEKVELERFMFGLSSDGRLLTENGRLYTDGGELYLDPEYESYVSEADLSRYTNIRDIVCCEGIIMLKNDGTVDWIDHWCQWDFSGWTQIEKLYPGCGCVYGLRRDGSVMMATCWGGDGQSNYMGWKLKELYVGGESLLGLTPEGKFVGDGDFSDYLLSSLN